MRRFLIIDSSGIMQFEHITEKEILLPETIDEQLVGGLLRALDAYANEVGGALQTLAIGVEKLAYRTIKINNDDSVLLVISDEQRTADDVLYLKSEFIVRKIIHILEDTGISDYSYSDESFLELIRTTNWNEELKCLQNYKVKKLLKLVQKQNSPNIKLENALNALLNEIPMKQVLLDPSLIVVDNKTIVVPANFSEKERNRLVDNLVEKMKPLLGERIVDSFLEKI
ncbi:MAG: hypothetical protein INQ03_00370 [Candidatus Heimdallarchaeota archaeon]|nr:hypothetical protein [Candidatus Heimdallarchaeota archaeon]